MLRKTLAKVQSEFSGARAFSHVAEICQHHRIQASPGYRDAALYCLKEFLDNGVPAEIITFAADGRTSFWTQQMMEEWDCRAATLDMIEPENERLADFADNKMSLIQRSISTHPGGVSAPLICLSHGDEQTDYADIDMEGAIVFTNGDLNKVRQWAVEKRGAIGIISDRMTEFLPVRHRYDIPDALQYTSFWWTGNERKCFGFVLSPKTGDRLRQLCNRMWQEHLQDGSKPAYPTVRAFVDAEIYNGSVEDVVGSIPGETDEEIVITAHLCHPQASANDNASGVAVALEVARALQSLVERGTLPKPRRGLRFLLIPEMTGTYAYLATHEDSIPQMLAGINLDMVGERQELCQGPLVAEYPPDASGSFVGDVLAAALATVAEETKNLAGTSSYALFKHAVTPFSGGSDHYILSDPSVGIPSPMLIQWPDKYYHTSEDTLDKVDPLMLYRVGCMTTVYAYFLANMGLPEALWVLGECRRRHLDWAGQQLQSFLGSCYSLTETELYSQAGEVRDLLHYRMERKVQAMQDLNRFLTADERKALEPHLQSETELLQLQTEQAWLAALSKLGISAQALPVQKVPCQPEYKRVPRRLFRGPVSFRGKLDRLPEDEQLAYQEFVGKHAKSVCMSTYLVYWADGTRTVAEIDHLTRMEIGVSDPEFALGYFSLLEKLGLITWS